MTRIALWSAAMTAAEKQEQLFRPKPVGHHTINYDFATPRARRPAYAGGRVRPAHAQISPATRPTMERTAFDGAGCTIKLGTKNPKTGRL